MAGTSALSEGSGRRVQEDPQQLQAQLEEERRRTAALSSTLSRERDILQAIIEHTDTQLAYLDPQFNFVWVNTAYARGSGYSKDDLIGHNHFELFPNPENQAIFERVRDTGQPVKFHAKPFEYADQAQRGTTYWDWTLAPAKDTSGQVQGLAFSLLEVTEQVRAEEERRAYLARMDALVAQLDTTISAIADAVVIYGPDGEILRLNPAAERLLGYSLDERGLPFAERVEWLRVLTADGQPFTSVEDLPARRALRDETVRNVPMAIRDARSGGKRWISVSAAPICSSDGSLLGAVASFTDITELHEARDELELRVRERTAELAAANEALRESEERFRRLAENARDIIYRIRMAPTRGFEYVSPAATEITGYTPEEHYADPDLGFKLVHPDDRPLLEALSHIGTAEVPPLVLRWVRKDGGIIWTEQRNVPIFDEAGELVALEGIARDITHRVQMATALRESEERSRHAFEYAPFGMALVGTDGRFLQVNASLCRSLGYGEQELHGKTFAELTFPDDLQVGLDLFEDLLAGRRDYGWLEKRYVRRDGHVIWTLVSTSVVRDSEGAPLYLVSQMQDITERKQNEEALWQQAQVIDQIHDSVIVTDLEGYVTGWNQGAERLTGYARAEALGRYISFLYPEDRQNFLQEEVIAPLQAKGAHEVEVVMQRKSGQPLYAHLSLSLLTNAEGAVIGMIGYSMDITEQVRAREALARSEARFRAQFRNIPIPTYTWQKVDDDFVLIDYNDAAQRSTNNHIAGYLGITLTEMYASEPQIVADFGRCFREQATIRREISYAFQHRSGTARFVIHYVFVPPDLVMVHTEDITSRKQAEEDLLTYVKGREVLQTIDRAILSASTLEQIAQAALRDIRKLGPFLAAHVAVFEQNRTQARVVSYSTHRPAVFDVGDLVPLEAFGDLDDFRQGKHFLVADIRGMAHVTTKLDLLLDKGIGAYVSLPMLVQEELVGALNLGAADAVALSEQYIDLARHVADSLAIGFQNAQLFDQVQAARERLEMLTRRLVGVQEEERRWLARELHDEIGQTLTAVKINLQTMQRLANGGGLAPRLEESIAIVERALQQVRGLALDLRPSLLDDLGLVAALRWYVDRQAQLAGFRASFLAEPQEMHLAPELEVTCFRVAQEALTNVMRHAQAQEVEVQLRRKDKELELTVQDDGVGFDVQTALDSAAAGTSMGLLSMRERVLLAGGQVDIVSAPGRGTEIQVRFPYSPRGEQ